MKGDNMIEEVKKNTEKAAPRWLLKLFTKVNVFVYRLSGGRLMNTLSGMPILLVKMRGVKSGKTHTIPLMHVPYDNGFLLVASQGGAPKNPAWYHNLIAHPDVTITFDGRTKAMRVRCLLDEEKGSFWSICCEYYPPYQEYQDRTDRNIPVFLCE